MAKKKTATHQSSKAGAPRKAKTKKTALPLEMPQVAAPIVEATEVPLPARARSSTQPPQAEVSHVAAQLANRTTDATPSAKSKRQKATKEPQPAKLSAIDAAAKVLAEGGAAMTTKAMIEQMASKGYWTSPGGQTPAATLYSAILRELSTQGETARFMKTERGKFALRTQG